MRHHDRRSWAMRLLGIGAPRGYNGTTRAAFYRDLSAQHAQESPPSETLRVVVELSSRRGLDAQARERLRRLPHDSAPGGAARSPAP